MIIQKNNDLNDQAIKPSSLSLIELWPPGYSMLPNSEGVMSEIGRSYFPSSHDVFEQNFADEKKLFEIYNLIKMKLMISVSNLGEIKRAEQFTLDLITQLENP